MKQSLKPIKKAEERSSREKQEKEAELQDNLCEMKNNVFGDLLTENPDVARSAFGSHRVITDRWKGMNEQQINDIRKTQAEQVRKIKKNIFLILNFKGTIKLKYAPRGKTH